MMDMKKTVGILFGGCSAEYPVSLKSATSVIQNLNPEKYNPILIGITEQGEWYRYEGPVEKLADDTWHQDPSCVKACIVPDRSIHGMMIFHPNGVAEPIRLDAAFPMLHGKNGEDGTVQGLLEMAGIPIVGCGTLSSALCMDKIVAHSVAQQAGIKVPKAAAIFPFMSHEEWKDAIFKMVCPIYVKPANGGSTIGMTKLENKDHLVDAVNLAFQYDDRVIAEQHVDGFEVGCSVLGAGNDLIMGGVDEIELNGVFFDFKEKYNMTKARIINPARIDEAVRHRIRETGLKLFRLLCCSGFARIDMFLTPKNEIVFNEVNTIPGFTVGSRYPKMMLAAGLQYSDVVEKLIDSAFVK